MTRLLWPALLALSLAVFLVPGLLGAALLGRSKPRPPYPPYATALVAITLSCAVGYAVFWAYFLDHRFGRVVAVVLLAASVIAVAAPTSARRLVVETARSRHVAVPVLLMLLVAVFYNGVLLARSSDAIVEDQLTGSILPPDNVLPSILARHLYNGTDPRPLLGMWQSSDRPPLQAGIELTQLPVASALRHPDIHYQLLSTALQCSWIPAVWALCAMAQFSRRATAFALTMAIFSGTFFLNSVFVWPKLLAASLVVLAFVLLFGGDRLSALSAALAAAGVGLALLAHTGVVFTLLPMAAAVLIRPASRPAVRPALAGAAVLLALLAPWSAYKHFYDPPGNTLSKMHLANVADGDDTRSLARSLADSYRSAGLSKVVSNKLDNVRAVVGEIPRWRGAPVDALMQLRAEEFFHMSSALGLLNLAWFGVLAWLVRRRLPSPGEPRRSALLMLAVAGLSVVVWVLLMFGPASTIMHQGSYATFILIFVALAGVIGTWPRAWSIGLAAVQIGWFITLWVVSVPLRGEPIGIGSAVIGAVSCAACAAVLAWIAVTDEPDADLPPSPGGSTLDERLDERPLGSPGAVLTGG